MSAEINVSAYKSQFSKRKEAYLQEWSEYLRFESVSTDPSEHYQSECRRCASWLSGKLTTLGLKSRLVETPGKPLVLAHWQGQPGKTRVLIYGHYDVQPVDPLGKWISPPFKPEIRDGRMYGRGTRDNKGQNFALIKAIETLISEKKLTCSVTVLLEGEEETGSGGLNAVLDSIRNEIGSDVQLICDSEGLQPGIPTIELGLRGMVKKEFVLRGPKADLHSGTHGGVCKNPAVELSRIIAQFHNPDGSVAVPGFYEGVREPSAIESAEILRLTFSEKEYLERVGTTPTGGEGKYPPLVRRGLRPTLEVNGLWSGYSGVGFKSIIPAEAHAKISCRLVYQQNPEKIGAAVEKFFASKVPAGMSWEQDTDLDGAPALQVDPQNSYVQLATRVLDTMYGAKTQYYWDGGSIPVLARIREYTKAEPLLVGFGLPGDNDHSPNESFGIDQLERNYIFGCLMLSALG